MKKNYDLWLDESGRFEQENKLKQRGYHPSLIGGILLDSRIASQIDFSNLIDETRTHAMDLNASDKTGYILPVLEKMRDIYHAKQVFFENSEYEDEASNRQLYLRMMAEGLLQLMQTLNAVHESVVINVLIAQRQDMKATAGMRRIDESEYIQALAHCIEQKKKERKVCLNEDSELRFSISVANRDKKLQLADFACNTRLTRDSSAFETVRERVEKLHADAYMFSLHESGTENYIKQCLVQGQISDAIMELFTAQDIRSPKRLLRMILYRMKTTSYRLVKVQLKQCCTDLLAYAEREDDFETGEVLLKRLNQKLIPVLKSNNLPYRQFQFTILLHLAGMYLREGDNHAAGETLTLCRNVLEEGDIWMEELPMLCQLMEKEAMLAVNEFDYERACRIMEKACRMLETIMQAVSESTKAADMAAARRSEWYGNALGVQLYAMMFQQRENPELYIDLCEISNRAFIYYREPEAELCRHRQYRCRIELEAGYIEYALEWLFLAKSYRPEKVDIKAMVHFLNLVSNTETLAASRYLLMHYLMIMARAKKDGLELADQMQSALINQKRLFAACGLEEAAAEHLETINMKSIKHAHSGVAYHPQEVLYWKYASYLLWNQQPDKALIYYERAANLCFAYKDYEGMYVLGFGIAAERICCIEKMGNVKAAKKERAKLLRRIMLFLDASHVETVKKQAEEMKQMIQDGTEESLWKAAEKIGY